MADYKTILHNIVSAIVEFPDQINISEETRNNEKVLTLNVAPSDMGKVIGKHGRIATSIRLVIRAAATKNNERVTVDIRD